MDVSEVRNDLIDEQDALDQLMASLTDAAWNEPTASPGWTVGDQIGHLAYFDQAASLAISDPPAFDAFKEDFWVRAAAGSKALDDFTLEAYRALPPVAALLAWRAERQGLADASRSLTNKDRVEWFGPSMSSRSFLTARLMEVWAHGQDIVDSLGLERPASDRLVHLAKLGFITRGWSFTNRGRQVADTAVRVELDAPSGDVWVYGDAEATESICGPAEDFCLVVTQRRHVDDTALEVHGDDAREWMLVAQAFAGPATDGPAANS